MTLQDSVLAGGLSIKKQSHTTAAVWNTGETGDFYWNLMVFNGWMKLFLIYQKITKNKEMEQQI